MDFPGKCWVTSWKSSLVLSFLCVLFYYRLSIPSFLLLTDGVPEGHDVVSIKSCLVGGIEHRVVWSFGHDGHGHLMFTDHMRVFELDREITEEGEKEEINLNQ